IRLYISSTFSDMRAEREYLHTVVFPALQARCEGLGVRVEAVDPLKDLRSEDEAEDPKILRGCLDGLDTCRPFFLGLLGERYGRPIERIPEDAAAAYPWLRACTGQSRLALETMHAVLRNRAAAAHAHFYFRRSSFLALVPEARRADFAAENTEAAAKLE